MARDCCATCQSRIKTDSKFFCCICNKTLYLTVECSEFDKKCVDVLLKLKDNVIHICNKTEKASFFGLNRIKIESLNEKKLSSIQENTNDELKKTSKANEITYPEN